MRKAIKIVATWLAAKLWPWPLVVLMVWLLLILTMLPLSVYTAYAHDATGQSRPGG